MSEIVIENRFHGLPDIVLGAYVGGILARGFVTAEATFRRPVRPARKYQLVTGSDGTRELKGGANSSVLAEARELKSLGVEPPSSVGIETARDASQGYSGFRRHPFPNCFVCGPNREEGDGLRIFPGRVRGHNGFFVAAPWIPSKSLADSDGMVRSEYVWSSLDCPTIWPLILYGPADNSEKVVSARIGVELVAPVVAGEPHVVMGWKLGDDGRSRMTGGAVYSADGQLLAKAKHTMLVTDWGVPLGLNYWPMR